jgi:hypothetical protein
MKILKTYKDLLKSQFEKGFDIERAWFTTFTLSPEFFESYVLPPLLKKEDEVPKSFIQFEEIISELNCLSTDSIKVFHDVGMPIDGIKKTTVDFIGIKPKEGLFHPKLSLFIFKSKDELEAFIMVGSANLSVDGWGRNRESIVFKKVETINQWAQINDFFKGLKQELNMNLFNLKSDTSDDWKLVHSYSSSKFLDEVIALKQKHWRVWSPYFSSEEYINYVFQKMDYSQIDISPDLVDGKLRMKTVSENLILYTDGQSEGQFCHAKTWLSSRYLIVGSHNFTQQAHDHINVEASIIQPLESSDWFNSVQFSKIENKSMDDAQFDEESLPSDLSGFAVYIKADHETKKITLLTEKMDVNGPMILSLPGNVDCEVKKWHGLTKTIEIQLSVTELVNFWRAIITDKKVEAKLKNSSPALVGSGFIQESNIEYRQAFRYTSLQSLVIDQLISRGEIENSGYKNVSHISETLGIAGVDQLDPYPNSAVLDYYQLYSFFSQIQKRSSEHSNKNLLNILWHRPDSLFAIKELIENFEKEHSELSPTSLSLIKYEFNSIVEKILILRDKDIQNKVSEIKELRFKFNNSPLTPEQINFLKSAYDFKEELLCN